MKLHIQKERDTPLLSRKRITAIVENQGSTPSREKLQEELAKALKADSSLVVIRRIFSRYGSQDVKIIAHLYTTKEKLVAIEDAFVQKKHEKKAAEAAAA